MTRPVAITVPEPPHGIESPVCAASRLGEAFVARILCSSCRGLATRGTVQRGFSAVEKRRRGAYARPCHQAPCQPVRSRVKMIHFWLKEHVMAVTIRGTRARSSFLRGLDS